MDWNMFVENKEQYIGRDLENGTEVIQRGPIKDIRFEGRVVVIEREWIASGPPTEGWKLVKTNPWNWPIEWPCFKEEEDRLLLSVYVAGMMLIASIFKNNLTKPTEQSGS